jgi:hypothetical protein
MGAGRDHDPQRAERRGLQRTGSHRPPLETLTRDVRRSSTEPPTTRGRHSATSTEGPRAEREQGEGDASRAPPKPTLLNATPASRDRPLDDTQREHEASRGELTDAGTPDLRSTLDPVGAAGHPEDNRGRTAEPRQPPRQAATVETGTAAEDRTPGQYPRRLWERAHRPVMGDPAIAV